MCAPLDENQWLLLVKNEHRANFLRDLPFIAMREGLASPTTRSRARITIEAVRGFARASRRHGERAAQKVD